MDQQVNQQVHIKSIRTFESKPERRDIQQQLMRDLFARFGGDWDFIKAGVRARPIDPEALRQLSEIRPKVNALAWTMARSVQRGETTKQYIRGVIAVRVKLDSSDILR